MEGLIAHPAWCRRADCVRTGTHESAARAAGGPGDLLGIGATLAQLIDGPRIVRLTVTEDGVTAAFSVPAEQARALHRALGDLLTS